MAESMDVRYNILFQPHKLILSVRENTVVGSEKQTYVICRHFQKVMLKGIDEKDND